MKPKCASVLFFFFVRELEVSVINYNNIIYSQHPKIKYLPRVVPVDGDHHHHMRSGGCLYQFTSKMGSR